jgi:tetratricopeptide (TPR) repeat protein
MATSTLLKAALRAFGAGQLGQAAALAADALRQDRRDPEALDLLARVAFARGAYEEAAAHASRLAELVRRDARPLLLLAEILAYQGRYRESIARYDRALRLEPGNAAAVAGKADVFEKRGDRDRARALLRPHLESGTQTPEMAIVQARLDLHDGAPAAVIAAARHHLEGAAAAGAVRAHLLFLLGKALERCGRFDEAFESYREGNEALSIPFSIEALVTHTDRLIEAYSRERLARLPRASNRSELPILVVGMPRSGSTLIETIIAAHPQAAAAGELPALQEIVNGLSLAIGSTLPYPECIADLEAADADRAAETYLRRLAHHAGRARRVVDKFLNNHRHVGLAALLLPAARVIHCTRDPLDTCFSCWAEPLPAGAYPYTTDLTALGIAYRQYRRIMDHWRDVLDPAPADVPYEELVADPRDWTRRVLDLCGLPFDERCLRYWESGRIARTASYDQVNRPVYASSVGRARRFEAHLGPLRRALEAPGT